MKGICKYPAIPLRFEPVHKSEMLNQLLFGESYTVLDEMQGWLLVKLDLDDYEGWIEKKQHHEVSGQFIAQQKKYPEWNVAKPFITATCLNDQLPIVIPRGATLPHFENPHFSVGSLKYKTRSLPHKVPEPADIHKVSRLALSCMHAPYLWGGRSPLGMDCSGFVQVVFKLAGFRMKRDTSQQITQGEVVDFIDEVKPGDLAFFDNPAGNIVHVGIMLSPEQIIHCSGAVKIDRIDHYGIFGTEERNYTHSLRIIKRMR